MILTLNQFEKAVPYTSYKRLELILPNLNFTLKKYGIVTNLRIAHFLTQILVETNYFRIVQYLETGERLENNAELGNTEKGDGRKYVGRGYLKIVGRSQYQEYKEASGIDVIANPHIVTTPRIAMDIAGWLWDKKQLNDAADKNDLEAITKLLTGEYLIIRERQEIFKRVVLAIS